MISTNHICTLTPQSQCYQEYDLPDYLTIQLPNHCIPKVLISAWCWRQIGHFRGRCTRAAVVHQHRGAFYVRGRQSGRCLGVNLKLVAIYPAVVCTSGPVYILYIYCVLLNWNEVLNCCFIVVLQLYLGFFLLLVSSFSSFSSSSSFASSLSFAWYRMKLEICFPDKENQEDTLQTCPGTWEPLMMDM